MSADIREFHIVAAVDFTDLTETVIEQAIDAASRHQRPVLHVVTVLTPARSFFKKSGRDSEAELVELEKVLRRMVGEKLADFGRPLDALDGWVVHLHGRIGQPAEEIAFLAAEVEADLIVVGRHGDRGRLPFFVGSVPERLLKMAACPVLVAQPVDYPAPETSADDEHGRVVPRDRLPRSAYMTSHGGGVGSGGGGLLL